VVLLYFGFHVLEPYKLLLFLMLAAVNIKGVFNTSNETKYEEAPDGILLALSILSIQMNAPPHWRPFFLADRYFY